MQTCTQRACFYLIFVTAFFFNIAQAQQELAVIPVSKISERTIRHVEIGDSVFATYRESPRDAASTRYKLVLPGGSVVSLNLHQLNKTDILWASTQGDSLCFYFVKEVEGEQVLGRLAMNRQTGKTKLSPVTIPLPEFLLGILDDNTLLTINKRDSTLRVKKLVDMKLVNIRQIKIPKGFMNTEISRAVIDDVSEPGPTKAASSLKFYPFADRLYITLDNVSASKDRAKTWVFRADLTQPSSPSTRYPVLYTPRGHFSSFLHDDLLYRVSKDRDGLYLQIFDSVTMVGNFTFNQSMKFRDSVAYIRGSDSKRVLNERTVWDAISNNFDVFISVHRYDSTRVILKVGGHKTLTGNGYAPMVATPVGLAASLLSYAIINTIKANSRNEVEESIDLYFYLIGNAKDGFTYWNGEGLTGHAIDAAELYKSKKSAEYYYKGYMHSKDFITAIYYKAEKNDAIRIVRYPRSR